MNRVVLYDTETSGFPLVPVDTQPIELQPHILEISVVMIEHDCSDFEVVDRMSTLVSGAKHIPKKITEINGVSMERLDGQPSWLDVRDRFMSMCDNAGIVCAHNFEFDARMVQIEEARLGRLKPFQNVKRRCSLKMSRQINKDAPSHNLGKLHKFLFNEDLKDAHTAEADTNGLVRLYMDLVKKGAWGYRES